MSQVINVFLLFKNTERKVEVRVYRLITANQLIIGFPLGKGDYLPRIDGGCGGGRDGNGGLKSLSSSSEIK